MDNNEIKYEDPCVGAAERERAEKNGFFSYIPIPARVFFCIFIFALTSHLLSFASETFANFFNEKIAAAVRLVLAKATGWVPFSLVEAVVIALPAMIAAVLIAFVHISKRGKRESVRFIVMFSSILTMLYSMFVLTLGTGYQNSPLDVKLGIERKPVSAEELYDTALKVSDELDGLVGGVYFPLGGGSSYMPYSLDEMNSKLNDAYDVLRAEHPFIPRLHSRVKYVALSVPWTYTHFSGVYCYYTGEANININFPDYTIPFTAAHELAHQRGVCPEDEANFVAFLCCISSDDAYIRYSGYQNMLEYLMNALYTADRDMYNELWNVINDKSAAEIRAYNEFFEPYRKSVASKVSSALNDTYLKALGESSGEKSYGMVVDLAVAYYKGK